MVVSMEDDDASRLFGECAESSLFIDDIYVDVRPLTVSGTPSKATWVMFDAMDDDGTEMFGNLYTRQSVAEVEMIHEAALRHDRPLEIRARRSLSLVPDTLRFWLVGEIRLASGLDQTSSDSSARTSSHCH
jgi:hypothetical protein